MSLKDEIETVERQLVFDKANAIAQARIVGKRTRRRATTPSALLLASSVGFITGEVINSRKMRKKPRKTRGSQKKSKSLLAPLISLAGTLWQVSSSLPNGDGQQQAATTYDRGATVGL